MTQCFEFTVGVNPGYFHDNKVCDPLKVVADAWGKCAEELFGEVGLYVPSILISGKAVYRSDWGCPAGGEDVVIVRGAMNPEFHKDPKKWADCVSEICVNVQDRLEQKTSTLVIQECYFLYLKNDVDGRRSVC